jgi:hypothetical protein
VPTFGFGIRPARAQDLAERADDAHRVGRGDDDVEVHLAGLDLGGEVVHADEVGAGGARFLGLGALREDGDALGLAGARRHHDRAANDLVGLLGVDAELDGDVDRLVELGGRALLDERERVVERIELGAVDLAGDRLLALGQLACPWCSR